MKKTLLLLIVLTVFLSSVIYIIRDNLKNNVSGNLKSFELRNFGFEVVPIVDAAIGFEILNNSFFNINLNNLFVIIYDANTNERIAQSVLIENIRIPKGVSKHEVVLKNLDVLSNTNLLLSNIPYRVLIRFNFLFINIEFEQIIN